MNQTELIQFINNPSQLNDSTITDITLLVEQYPYFQVAQLLRIKNLHNVAPDSIKSALSYTAAYLTDRKILYYLLHSIEEKPQEIPIDEAKQITESKSREKNIKDTLQENISDAISNQIDYYKNNSEGEIEFSAAIDVKKEYGQGIELDDLVIRINSDEPGLIELQKEDVLISKVNEIKQTESATTNEPVHKKENIDILSIINKGIPAEQVIPDAKSLSDTQIKKNKLIDSFILSNPKIAPVVNTKIEEKDQSENSVQEHDHLITDTLASIYLRQGNYAKAIFAYEKLSLKYPEKSTYFAAQINEIKKLIEKNK